MKTLINFSVTGSTKNEILENAQEEYRKFIDIPDAPLPSNTVVQMSSDVIEESAYDGRVAARIVKWSGYVTISQNTN